MITLAWYLLKITICSGILCGYYFLALRNKIFHQWNRFYLLASIALSLLVPLMKINIFQTDTDKGTVVQMLQTISASDEAVIEYSRNSGFQLNSENIISTSYLLITTIFLSIFLIALYKIKILKKKYPETKIEGINFVTTDAKGTPFSFFNSIFWNNAIDLYSKPGQQIFNHEIAHVKEKHSYDKIFMNVVLIFFWINPFFWLLRKELNMIHEFIADKKAVEDNDISAFAEMILHTVYPGQKFPITNNFFYSPLKRRILMLTKNKNPKVTYLSRLLVLPLAAIVFFAFTLKVKTIDNHFGYNEKTITVVIDAGHGGEDIGGVSADGLKEKDINLSIAKKIAEINSNDHIKILLSRDNDKLLTVKDRVKFASKENADLFLSIHVNATDKNNLTRSGFSVIIDKKNTYKNKILASALIEELKKSYTTDNIIAQRQNGVWVLDENICPAVLIECGYLTNPADEAFITNSFNQEKIAKNILDAIDNYYNNVSNSIDSNPSPVVALDGVDSIPEVLYDNKKIRSIEKTSESDNVKITFEDGTQKNISEAEAKEHHLLPEPPPVPPVPPVPVVVPIPPVPPTHPQVPPPPPIPPKDAVYIIDGKMSTKEEADKLDKNHLKLHVYTGEAAVKKYGEKAKNGAIEINTKKEVPTSENVLIIIDGKETTKNGMNKISPNSIESINVLKDENATKKYGEKGKNGVIEIHTKTQTITKNPDGSTTELFIDNVSTKQKNDVSRDSMPHKLFTKVENEAEFPGGKTAWFAYITKAIEANQNKFTESDFGTCVVKFIVNTDGTVSNVEATTMKGTRLATTAVQALITGPKWIPAKQNNHVVASYRLLPVTYQNDNTTISELKKGAENYPDRLKHQDNDVTVSELKKEACLVLK